MKAVKFYPYAAVTDRLFCIEYDSNSVINKIEDNLIKFFNESGIKCRKDNKIVFEVEKENGMHVFYGFYDWHYCVGYNYYKVS